jgi:hypothetical protein
MMSDDDPIDWRKTTFDGSRREQLRRARIMTVRQRFEGPDELTRLSEGLQAMRRNTGQASDLNERFDTFGCQACNPEGSNGVF